MKQNINKSFPFISTESIRFYIEFFLMMLNSKNQVQTNEQFQNFLFFNYPRAQIIRRMIMLNAIKMILEKTPPELASDIMEKGIMLAGGGALIQNLDKLISLETGMPVYITDEPLDCVVKGTEKTLQDIEKLRTILLNSRKRR